MATPEMLMDELASCREAAEALLTSVESHGIGWERRHGLRVNPLAERLNELHADLARLTRLLQRGGLWTDAPVEEVISADGRAFLAVREPFTGSPAGAGPTRMPIPTRRACFSDAESLAEEETLVCDALAGKA